MWARCVLIVLHLQAHSGTGLPLVTGRSVNETIEHLNKLVAEAQVGENTLTQIRNQPVDTCF